MNNNLKVSFPFFHVCLALVSSVCFFFFLCLSLFFRLCPYVLVVSSCCFCIHAPSLHLYCIHVLSRVLTCTAVYWCALLNADVHWFMDVHDGYCVVMYAMVSSCGQNICTDRCHQCTNGHQSVLMYTDVYCRTLICTNAHRYDHPTPDDQIRNGLGIEIKKSRPIWKTRNLRNPRSGEK